jgi:hypothetical protein
MRVRAFTSTDRSVRNLWGVDIRCILWVFPTSPLRIFEIFRFGGGLTNREFPVPEVVSAEDPAKQGDQIIIRQLQGVCGNSVQAVNKYCGVRVK